MFVASRTYRPSLWARLFLSKNWKLKLDPARRDRITVILCNDRDPSRYIKELREIAGDNVQYESIDGRPIRQCPSCHSGQLVKRTGPKGSSFTGCSTFPACRHTEAET